VDTIAGLDEFGDVADPVLVSSAQPSVAIKVLDKRHSAVYTWSLDRMQQRLQRMRNLTTYIDRPSYTQHFSSDEPFYNSPPPEYCFIGNALISLAPLSRRLSSISTVPIFCRYTAEAIGSCRVDIKIVNVVMSVKKASGSKNSTRPSSPAPGTVPPGSKLTFFLTVDTVKGLSCHDFSAVHLQVRLSSFVGPTLISEEVFPSSTLDINASTLLELKFRRSFSIIASSRVLAHLRQGYSPIEFFASIRPTYIQRLERWDEMREQRHYPNSGMGIPSSDRPTFPPMRRSETDFVVAQAHDVIAWLRICELGPDGQYAPVPVVSQNDVDPGCFSLHQGLQRRISLSLSSNSGQQLPWVEVTKVRMGNLRLLDQKGRVHESTAKALATLPLLQGQVVEFKPDGTGTLSAEALWDSSVHGSILLNRVTTANQRILIQLHWAVTIETCSDPVQFATDVAVNMQTRDARPPSKLMSFLGSHKILNKTSMLFSIRLSPPLTRSPKDLWRLDTSEKYVRGEELLGGWKPRGISVIEDSSRLVSTERRAADVQAVRVILSSFPPQPVHSDTTAWRSDNVSRKAIDLWQKRFGHRGEVCHTPVLQFNAIHTEPLPQIVLCQDPNDPEESNTPSVASLDELKFTSDTKLIPRR
jgi:kinesin family protein 1